MNKKYIKKSIGSFKSVFLVSFIGILFIFSIKTNVNKEAINYIQELNYQIAQRIESTTNVSFKNLEYINSYIDELKKTYGNEYDENIALIGINNTVSKHMFNSVGIADINGIMNFGEGIVDIKDREYFQQAMNGKEYISKVITGRHNNKLLIGYAKPLKDDNGEIEGVIVAYSDYKEIIESLDIKIYSGKVKSYILNKDGDVIVGNKDEYIKNENAFHIMINNNTEAIYEEGVYKTEDNYISCSKVKGNQEWFVVSEIPTDIVFKNLNNIIYLSIAAVIIYITIYILREKIRNKINKKNYLNVKFIDELTNIENKKCFKVELKNILEINKNVEYILLSLDIVSFKFINEIFGYNKGNEILKKVAEDIKGITNKVIIGRIENDVFGIVIKYTEGMEISEEVEKIKESIKTNNILEESSHNLEFNIGITKIKYGDSIEKKLDEMDLARVECKNHNELNYYLYDKKLEKRRKEMLIIQNELLSGLSNGEFKVLYQPKIDCITKEIVGVEALIRWISKEYGFISPAIFIPIAEKNGNINIIGKWVLEEVCKIIKKSMDENKYIVPISVNISRVELYRSDFIEMVKQLINKYSIDTKLLEFEITETTALNDTKYINEQIQKIKELGIKVSMDDFGTGSSTLSNLKCIDIDILKIDRSMLLDIEKNKKSKALIKNIINIAKEFGFSVVCEGIETIEQVEVLEKINCDVIQGYVFSKPIEWKEVQENWLIK